ncbi:hypothetical protein [Spongiimicrobium salis]|uniref:hypothetical protein n=1 Tax=Spongiimicrobium salis TaxID=1667022 RepID=UPI00374D3816
MKPIFILLFVVASFWSMTITIKAIYLILTKKFNASKSTWILTVMIACIGPILWIVKGKKLIEK